MTLRRQTLVAALERAAASPDTGLRFLDRRERSEWLSWSELRLRARRVAGGLVAMGLERGERVGLIYPTGESFFVAFFGIQLAGAVPVPLYPPVRLGRLDEYHRRTAAMLRSVRACLVLADRRARYLLGETIAQSRLRHGCRTLEELPAAEATAAPVGAEDLALVQFSSGTTVEPKPVALTQRAVMSQVTTLNSFWPDSDVLRHTGVSWLPLYHDMGLIGCVFPALERPSVLTLIPPELFVARPAVWLRTISRYRATVSPAPNFAYGLCVEKILDEELRGVDLSSWRVALNGAEPVVPEVLRAFNRRFSRWGLRAEALTPVYGLSEAALAVTFSSPERPFESRRFSRRALAGRGEAVEHPAGRELVSLGRPLAGFELSVRDEQGRELGAGRLGRLWVRGPSLMSGYLGRPDATRRTLRDGWLDTGDLGFVHHGELFLTGRAKELIIVRGRNHAPEEIEQAANRIAAVRTGCLAAVSYLPEGAERESVLLLVEHAKEASGEEIEQLADKCRRVVLAENGLPLDRVIVLSPGTLPRTSSGKIRRGEALRQHLAGRLRPPARFTPLAVMGSLARSYLGASRGR